jgi:hypothetical protein
MVRSTSGLQSTLNIAVFCCRGANVDGSHRLLHISVSDEVSTPPSQQHHIHTSHQQQQLLVVDLKR